MTRSFALTQKNPAGWAREEPGTGNLLVAAVDDYTGGSGGIERVDLVAGQSRGLVVTAAALGNRYVSDFVVAADGTGFVSVVDPQSPDGQGRLLTFHLDGRVDATALLTGHPAGLALDGCNHLWVVERGYGAGAPSGLHVFDAATRMELTGAPIATSLPPRFWGGIVFVP
jgi:hypothetical protein